MTNFFKLEIDRTYPKNDPANAAFVRNFVYTIAEPNQQNGISFSYQNTSRAWSSTVGVSGQGQDHALDPRSGIINVSGLNPVWFPEEDVKGWSKAFKSSIAYYVELGALIARDDTLGILTADQVRAY